MGRPPMTEETKKKISEALKKNGGAPPPPPSTQTRSKEMAGLEATFSKSQKNIDQMKSTADAIKAEAADLKMPEKPKGKMTPKQKADRIKMAKAIKEGKAQVREKLKEIKEKIKAEREIQRQAKEQARILKAKENAAKKVEHAKAAILKVASNQKKLDALESKSSSLIAKAKTPEQKQRIADALQRIKESRSKQEEALNKAKSAISENQNVVDGKVDVAKSNKGFFRFSQPCFLSEKSYTPWRALKEIEKKVDFKFLNASFNELEGDFTSDLNRVVNDEMQRNISKVSGKIKAGDIAAIAAMSFLSFPKIYAIVSDYTKKAFEVGKKTGSDEMKVERPVTPTQKTQLNNFTSAQIAEDFINEVNSEAKKSAKIGLAKGIAPALIIATINGIVKDRADAFVKDASSTVVNNGINEGRRLVFEKNITEIIGYLRSEILDDRTCPICEALDGAQVKPSDAMAQLDQVHTNCRGVWVPILNDEDVDDKWGVSKTIRNAFDTENRYGIPYTNGFKQLKVAK
jgi:hypothetical protein